MKTIFQVEKMISLSKDKYKYLQAIYDLTNKQTNIIIDENIEELNEILANKDVFIKKIDKLDDEFNTNFRKIKKELGVDSFEQISGSATYGIKELQQQISKIMQLIKAICEIEEKNNSTIKKKLDGTNNKIKHINTGKRAVSAYRPVNPIAPSYYINKQK